MKPKKAGSVRRLLPYMKGYWKECILGPIFKLLEAIFELIVPLVTAKMIDVGIANRDTGYIWKMGGAMFLLAACGLAFALFASITLPSVPTASARHCGGHCTAM